GSSEATEEDSCSVVVPELLTPMVADLGRLAWRAKLGLKGPFGASWPVMPKGNLKSVTPFRFLACLFGHEAGSVLVEVGK
ncbi:MAG: hypothetical protein M1305_05675, partial [Candidatus Marsarchaeota archaeon]|nr:hypothetical protein [Candidatus Marsarchaeota archaeon]